MFQALSWLPTIRPILLMIPVLPRRGVSKIENARRGPNEIGAPASGIRIHRVKSPDAPAQRSRSRLLDPGSSTREEKLAPVSHPGNEKLFTGYSQPERTQR